MVHNGCAASQTKQPCLAGPSINMKPFNGWPTMHLALAFRVAIHIPYLHPAIRLLAHSLSPVTQV